MKEVKTTMDTLNKSFPEVLLQLLLTCHEGNTDNCDISMRLGKYQISCNIKFTEVVETELEDDDE